MYLIKYQTSVARHQTCRRHEGRYVNHKIIYLKRAIEDSLVFGILKEVKIDYIFVVLICKVKH